MPTGEAGAVVSGGLRDYQRASILRVREEMARGHKRVVLVLPTGAGKTRTAAETVAMAVNRGSRVLWLVHRRELVDQAAAALTKLDLDVGVHSPSSVWPMRPDAPVQVASIQTLVARAAVRPPADLIVWDECHHAGEGAAEWIALLDSYPDARVLGLTATPERGDGTGLAPIFTSLVVGTTVRRLTEAGHLVPCEVVRPDRWLRGARGKGNPLAQDPIDAYREHAPGRSGFLFASSVERATEYAQRFNEAGVRAACIHAGTPDDERAAALALFARGSLRMLTNVYVMTEGVDLPAASVCILASQVGTAGGYIQRVGRVLRPARAKTDAVLIDLPGLSHIYGPPEEDRHFELEGKAISVAGRVCQVCGQPLAEYPCPTCGYELTMEERQRAEDEILNEKLAKFERKRAEGDAQRRETVRRWVQAARAKGHKPASVRYKFKAVYGVDCPDEWYREALR